MPATTPLTLEQFDLPHPRGEGAFRITVARPDGLPEGAKVPVLLVTDSDILFGVAAEIARLRAVAGSHPHALVVGIGYGADFMTMAKLRTADLTPPLSEAGRAAIGGLSGLIGDKDGGADAFLTFLTDALPAELARRLPEADLERTALFGHSLGGLFVAYALLTRPQAFPVFLGSSPSLWWDDFAIRNHLEGLEQRLAALPRTPHVFLDVGAKEQDIPTEAPPSLPMTLEQVQALVANCRMVDALAEFADTLRAKGLSDLVHVRFPEEDHNTVIPPALNRGLTFALAAFK
jgi:predicted alpha/beta superfamily hydrolase